MQTQLLDGTWSLSSVDPSAIVNNCSYFSNINRIDIDIATTNKFKRLFKI